MTYVPTRVQLLADASDKRYASALGIYIERIPDWLRLDTNYLAYWLHNWHKQHGRQLYVIALLNTTRTLGWFQAVDLGKGLFLINSVAFATHNTLGLKAYTSSIAAILQRATDGHLFTLVELATEIPNFHSLRRWLRTKGFREVEAPYLMPRHGRLSLACVPGRLFIKGLPADRLSANEYLTFVSRVYFGFHAPWRDLPGLRHTSTRSNLYTWLEEARVSVRGRSVLLS